MKNNLPRINLPKLNIPKPRILPKLNIPSMQPIPKPKIDMKALQKSVGYITDAISIILDSRFFFNDPTIVFVGNNPFVLSAIDEEIKVPTPPLPAKYRLDLKSLFLK